MATTESSRLEMHLKLKSVLGDKVADTMMDHLPPTGWADVARQSDIDHLAALMDARFAGMDYRIDSLDTRINALDKRIDSLDKRIDLLDKRIDSLEARMVHGMWMLAGLSVTLWGSVFGVIITKF